MTIDMTVNLPIILTILGIGLPLVWKASQLVEKFAAHIQRFAEHVDSDKKQFDTIDHKLDRGHDRFTAIETKLDRVLHWDGRDRRSQERA